MTNDTENFEVIDITPTWETAVRIYLQVLRPSCKPEVLQMATEDLLMLARSQDNAIEAAKKKTAQTNAS
jgi:hypothetical protein